MTTYPTWVYPMWAFISMCLVTIPLPWHLEAWNTGTCLYMIWTGLACLNAFVNSVVWQHDALVRSPVWCDISSRFIIGYAVAVPAASLCINRRLYHIATSNSVTVTKAEKRRAILVDLSIGVGIPVLQMILQYIPQGHRFNIFEEIGCYPFTYNTPVAFVLVYSWPIIIGLISACYCVLSIRAFNKRRAQFKELLSANSNLSSNRYFRLMCLAGIDIACTVPLGCFALWLDIQAGIQPWLGWDDTHANFSNVDQFPSIFWRADKFGEAALELTRWSPVICAMVFFAFFGFADEAQKNYRLAVNTVAKRMGISSGTLLGSGSGSGGKWKLGSSKTGSKSGTGGTLPVFIERQTQRKRDSLDSFTDISASYNEKSMGSFGGLSFNDVGGALNDDGDKLASPTDSDASSILTPSVHHDAAPARPEPVFNFANVPNHEPDTPKPATFRHSFIV